MTCANCGSVNSDDFRFCGGCGAKLTGSLKETAAVAAPPAGGGERETGGGDHDPLLGQIIDGRYRLDSKIGAGGMGVVYLATRLSIGDEVAVKILYPERVADAQAAERFRREAQAAARLKHPNAVTIHDFGVSTDGMMYLVMELVEGESLREVIERHGPLPAAVVSDVAAQVCSALDEAHRLGIVHRDVKPDNIVLRETRSGLRVKVLDFGIAKLHDLAQSKLTQTGGVLGTPHYMSPEQCMGEDLDQRSDIYSTGVVLYEMLRGVVPFDSPTTSAVIVAQVTQAPPPLLRVTGGVTPAVEAVVLRALEKRREARQQSAGELARELSAAVHGTAGLGYTTVPITSAGAATTPISGESPWPPATGAAPQPFSGITPSPTDGGRSSQSTQTPAAADVKRSYLPAVLVVALLAVFAAGAVGVAVWFGLARAGEGAEKPEPTLPIQAAAKKLDGGSSRPPAAQTGSAPGRDTGAPASAVTAAPVAPASADDEINSLRALRARATPSEAPRVAAAIEEDERRYPADYRFTYERAKLFVTSHDHHRSFDLLFLAGRKAIGGGKASEMLDALALDAGGDFAKLTRGHREWDVLLGALRSGDAGDLVPEGHH